MKSFNWKDTTIQVGKKNWGRNKIFNSIIITNLLNNK